MKFNNLEAKLQHAKALTAYIDPLTKTCPYPKAMDHVVNAHGKFYGLRSKYDGNGNLRMPIKAISVA